MQEIGDLKLYSFDEIKDEFIGVIGSKEREKYEKKLEAELSKNKLSKNKK